MSTNIETVSPQVTISPQITVEDVAVLAGLGVEVVVCNRPEDEHPIDDLQNQVEANGMTFFTIAFKQGEMNEHHVSEFSTLLQTSKRVHAYCRTGSRSKKLWQDASKGFDALTESASSNTVQEFDVVIVGAGSAGIATASSLLKRDSGLKLAVIDPSEDHYYQPGWTMVGGGVFDAKSTCRKTRDLLPAGVTWLKASVTSFSPEDDSVALNNGATVHYQHLVVAPGLTLDWQGIEGLQETLGENGVTSNYRYDLAPYTWQLVQNLKSGRALFTQPPMPIKCAGAPQKALYLSADYWLRNSALDNIDVEFYNSASVLFGVPEYVPALQAYMDKYQTKLNYMQTLVKVDGLAKLAWFKNADGELTEKSFDFLHVCPPQRAPDFVSQSELSDKSGWLDVDQHTLNHSRFDNIWGVGDVINTPNAKTMAAARKQAPIVASNIANRFAGVTTLAEYDGYGSCPLTVANGKIVLAEFGYGGKLLPTFPKWLNDGTKPTKLAWLLKSKLLPWVYWQGMLKGREWLAGP